MGPADPRDPKAAEGVPTRRLGATAPAEGMPTRALPDIGATPAFGSRSSGGGRGAHPSSGLFAPGYALLGRYAIRQLLSQGGEGQVFECEDLKSEGTVVAAKVYYPSFMPTHEAIEALEGISHPDLLRILAYGDEGPYFVEVSEFAQGGSLARAGRLAEERLAHEILPEIVNGLRYLHERGIIHLDVKPSNLYFRSPGGTDLVIGDFGTLKCEKDPDRLSLSRSAIGTAPYMPPEAHDGAYGPKTDAFALGVTVCALLHGDEFFMLSGPTPEVKAAALASFKRSIHEADPVLPECSGRFESLIRGLLFPQPGARWGLSEVARWLKGEDPPVPDRAFHLAPSFRYSLGAGMAATDATSLARMLFENMDLALEHLATDTLGESLQRQDQSLAKDLRIARSRTDSPTKALLHFVYGIDKALPYRLLPELAATDPADLAAKIDRDAKTWQAGRSQLFDGTMLIWLRQTGWAKAADAWKPLREEFEKPENQDRGLEQFLHLLNPKLPSPRLSVEPLALDFGKIRIGEKRIEQIRVANKGRGFLAGTSSLDTKIDGCTVDPVAFRAGRGGAAAIDVSVEGRGEAGGATIRTSVRLTSNGEPAEVTVPVRYRLLPSRAVVENRFVMWTAPALWIVFVALLSSFVPDRMGPDADTWVTLATLGSLIGVPILLQGICPDPKGKDSNPGCALGIAVAILGVGWFFFVGQSLARSQIGPHALRLAVLMVGLPCGILVARGVFAITDGRALVPLGAAAWGVMVLAALPFLSRQGALLMWLGRNSSAPAAAPMAAAWIDELDGESTGNASGVHFVSVPNGKAAQFRLSQASRIEYPERFPEEGTFEMWVRVDSAYRFQKFSIATVPEAVLFTTDNSGQDVAWPGASSLRASRDGTVSFTSSTAKGGQGPNQEVRAVGTNFAFGEWHAIGVTWGSAGQALMVDGLLVAKAPANTIRLGAGGTHEGPEDVPTIGEALSRFWKQRQHGSGFEGLVARVRVSPKPLDWDISMKRPFQSAEALEPVKGVTISGTEGGTVGADPADVAVAPADDPAATTSRGEPPVPSSASEVSAGAWRARLENTPRDVEVTLEESGEAGLTGTLRYSEPDCNARIVERRRTAEAVIFEEKQEGAIVGGCLGVRFLDIGAQPNGDLLLTWQGGPGGGATIAAVGRRL